MSEEYFEKYLDARFSAITTLINARFEVVDGDLKDIKDHVKQTNGRVTELECESKKREKVVDDFHRLETRIGFIKKRWFVILGLFVLLILLVNFLYDIGMLQQLFEKWIRG